MIKPAPPKSRGAAGVLFVILLAVATAGLLVDVLVIGGRGNILTAPGGRAMLGVAVAAGAALIAFALRFTLGQAIKDDEGGASVRDHT